MNVCVVSFKECWRDASGAWMTDGGFPRQMTAIASLFDEMVIVGYQESNRHAIGLSEVRDIGRLSPII